MYHASIIKAAIKHKVNVVTTSYVSDAMRELDASAREAGIVVLNEVGVDPGVDHLYAIKKIDEVHDKGGKHNSAHFLSANKEITISKTDLMGVAKPYFVLEGYDFVAYPNRDSVPFREYYGIPEAETVIRGSLRYAGNPAFVKALIGLGWLDTEPKDWLKTGLSWAQVFQKAIEANDASESTLSSRVNEICHFPTKAESSRILSGLHWIGLFSSNPATIRGNNLLDTPCAQLEKQLSHQLRERDLVIL
ncbi:MAG: hypothetical protein L6R38_006390 [Xanthoria sp. 2 TBL-2021]|nr:MAG: hypothetical protein L6R38_006390 [Xanthoria sp. 2 TBL-2021]